MATLGLRDRDGIITKEGLIFRVFGHIHPSKAYICDAEYAPEKIFKSNNPKAPRNQGQKIFYKFYEDEGWRFIRENFPQYTIFHEMLQKKVIGIYNGSIVQVRKPDEELERLIKAAPEDNLLAAMQDTLELVTQHSKLPAKNFGLFGSMLHGFHHPEFSDIDLIVYGRKNMAKLRETLQEMYDDKRSLLRNEFETDRSIRGKQWRFRNYSPKEYVWHQKRKMIYALLNDERTGRIIKTEFEPVKDWKEISNEYDAETRIIQKGWVKILARVIEDSGAPFIPSIYGIEPLSVLNGERDVNKARRIISYMEEFRMQACRDETIYVEGNLEKVTAQKGNFYQIALTYCPRYYEQVLKVVS